MKQKTQRTQSHCSDRLLLEEFRRLYDMLRMRRNTRKPLTFTSPFSLDVSAQRLEHKSGNFFGTIIDTTIAKDSDEQYTVMVYVDSSSRSNSLLFPAQATFILQRVDDIQTQVTVSQMETEWPREFPLFMLFAIAFILILVFALGIFIQGVVAFLFFVVILAGAHRSGMLSIACYVMDALDANYFDQIDASIEF